VAEPLAGTASPADSWLLADPAATARFGAALAGCLPAAGPDPLVLYLEGDLGAGKTSLVRGLLAGLGHAGRVPSPTYTLVEPYVLGQRRVLHVDLYRLRDPAELDDLGLADDLSADERGRAGLLLAEWPGRGMGRLPMPDLILRLAIDGDGRRIALEPRSDAGGLVVRELGRALPAGF